MTLSIRRRANEQVKMSHNEASCRSVVMKAISPHDSAHTNELLVRAAEGDHESLGQLLERDRARLRRMIAFRLDRRLHGRIDPSDVIQEAQLEAAQRLKEYVANPTMPLFLWLRLITGQCLLTFHRRHLGASSAYARCRSTGRAPGDFGGARGSAYGASRGRARRRCGRR